MHHVTRAQAASIRRLTKHGISARQIHRHYEGLPGERVIQVVAKDFRTGDDRYDPFLDEVAIERALQGDLKAGAGLTHFERQEVILRVESDRRRGDDGWIGMVATAIGYCDGDYLATLARRAA